MTIPEAVGLLLKAAYSEYGQLCVLDMGRPKRILDLAREMISLAGLRPDIDIQIETTGLRPGENMHEREFAEGETTDHKVDDKIFVVETEPPGPNFIEKIEFIGAAAAAEDDERVLHLLGELVPGFGKHQAAVAMAAASM